MTRGLGHRSWNRARTAGWVALLLCLAVELQAASLTGEIDRLVKSSPAAESAFWGIEIVELDSGKSLYSLNAGHLFVPASNAKLFTLALALARLGPAFRFATRVVAATPPDTDGLVRGGLQLVGGGDPNLSARVIPYRTAPVQASPLAGIEALADQLLAQGVKHVDGGIVGDDTWYVWEPYPEGWTVDDTQFDYGAPVSALSLNDNMLTVTVRPGAQADDPAELTLQPPLEYYEIDNRVRTVVAGGVRKVQINREPGSRLIRLWGTIPLRDGGEEMLVAVDDPAEYAARALRRALQERGVTVDGGVSVRHRFANESPVTNGGVELARLESAPLGEDLRITGKVSQNLHAELALRAVARARRNEGSRPAGLEELNAFLSEIGIDADSFHFSDGSGLTRLDLVTPDAVIQLLRFMYQSPTRADWIDLLPVGGQDGTLKTRLGQSPAAGRIHAKTGTLTHVSALSGYAERRDGSWVAFSILVNNHNGHAAEVRGLMDRICTLIVE